MAVRGADGCQARGVQTPPPRPVRSHGRCSMPDALIIDDDPDFLASLAELIRKEGFSVALASSLEEARKRIAENPPDVVISDLMLPDGNGSDLLQEVETIT